MAKRGAVHQMVERPSGTGSGCGSGPADRAHMPCGPPYTDRMPVSGGNPRHKVSHSGKKKSDLICSPPIAFTFLDHTESHGATSIA
jgi:hypothetical protein